jgi:DNA-binding LacI/PurR family transcriptional regulator
LTFLSSEKATGDERRAITLHDVARAANVSAAAVSQALNNVGTLRPETREHIHSVAKKLGYVPNRYASGLRRQRAMVIGFVSNTDLDHETSKRWAHFYGAQLRSLVDSAGQMGYTVTVIPDGRPELLNLAQVDALYLADVLPESAVVIRATAQGIPMVTYEYDLPDFPSVTVRSGYERATVAALDALAEKGLEKIGLLTEENGYPSDEIGETTYRSWCALNGREPIVAVGDYGRTNLEEKICELRESGVDGFFSFYEEGPRIHALSLLAEASGTKTLEFIALCLDDCDENGSLGVAHVCVHPDRAPSHAVEQIVALVEKRPVSNSIIELPITLNF